MKNRMVLILLVLSTAAVLAGCSDATPTPTPAMPPAIQATTTPQGVRATTAPQAAPATTAPQETPVKSKPPDAQGVASAFQKGGCGACHVVPGIPNAAGAIGPDLSKLSETAQATLQDKAYTGKAKNVADYIREAIVEPDVFVASGCPGGACQKGLMPATLAQTLSDDELAAIVNYLKDLPAGSQAAPVEVAPSAPAAAPVLSGDEFASAKQIFFERCAGCHGTLRKGATGPALTPDKTLPKGTVALAAIIFNGTPRGMPDWGKQGVLTQAQAEMMAKYLQNEPPSPPEMSLAQMLDSWKLFVPPDQRPTAP
jgi:nitrite reductase (NO-forming)/hydroxylamine reductase